MSVKPDTALSAGRVNKIGVVPAVRQKEPLVTVWDKEGNSFQMTRMNANDKVNHDGWFRVNPNAATADSAEGDEGDEGDEVDKNDKDVATVDTGPIVDAMGELQALRDAYIQATQLQPDMRWGKARLREEIDNAMKVAAATA